MGCRQHESFFENLDGPSNKNYNAASEASGLINLVSLLVVLYDNEIKVLLIDEPEVSLHPQLQAFLLQEIKNICGSYEDNTNNQEKMVVIATHSTEMINLEMASDIQNIVFFAEDRVPKQLESNQPELNGIKLQEIILKIGH